MVANKNKINTTIEKSTHLAVIRRSSKSPTSMSVWTHLTVISLIFHHFTGTFQSLDLDGDGRISRDERLTCGLGFYFDVGEERFHHGMGQIKD